MNNHLHIHNLTKYYVKQLGWLKQQRICALDAISFTVKQGETVAVIGETGSGKSTLIKLIAGIETPHAGTITLNGLQLKPYDYASRCCHIRMIFQDGLASLDPQRTIGQQLLEPLWFNTRWTVAEQREYVLNTLQKVGLLPEHFDFYPHMLASGQLARVSIARAILLNPQVIVADEALGALDPSIRAQIINLLIDLKEEMGVTLVFASHSPEIVRHLADKILVLHHGKMIEFDTTTTLITNPQQSLTRSLLHTGNLTI